MLKENSTVMKPRLMGMFKLVPWNTLNWGHAVFGCRSAEEVYLLLKADFEDIFDNSFHLMVYGAENPCFFFASTLV